MSGLSERNPFVGPRPILEGEELHGRSKEVRELYNRLQARRIVVLHSPSGAGKSSLVYAGLVPRLRAGGFDVWRPIRVNLDSDGLEGVPEGTNRYLLSAMVSLEEEVPQPRRRSPAALAGMELVAYLESRPRRKAQLGRPVVLVFDQLEEVLTIEPRAVAHKREFFAAVGRALDSERYWALLVIREDHLPAFAPFRDRFPTQMSNTSRLDFLGLAGAREAAEQLARKGGREFPAVDRLVRDLSAVQVQQRDGSFVTEQGEYVEPVLLQVVCRRLWESIPEGDTSIDEVDVSHYGGVSEALGSYYADAVSKVADGDLARERAIREWVGSELIVGGIRSQVRQEVRQSAGLDNGLIEQLKSSYLIRSEHRAGINWFELGHDRLVEPIQRDNHAWEQEHLHPLQVQARLWEGARRSQTLLLSAEALVGAVEWAEHNRVQLTESEREFLELSQALRAQEAEQRRRQRAFTTTITVAGLLAIVAAAGLFVMYRRAQEATTAAEAATEAAEAATERERDAKLEAVDSQRKARAASLMAGARELLAQGQGGPASLVMAELEEPENVRGWSQLVTDLLAWGIPRVTLTHQDVVTMAVWSSDGQRIVTVAQGGAAWVWNADGTGDPVDLAGQPAAVVFAAWSPDGRRIVTTSNDGIARVWVETDGKWVVTAELIGHEAAVTSAEWSPSGEHVVTSSEDGTARIWALDRKRDAVVLSGHTEPIQDVAWSPDGRRVATASVDETVRVWSSEGGALAVLPDGGSTIWVAAWSPDGRRIATGSEAGVVRWWNVDGNEESLVLEGHGGRVQAIAWHPAGTRFATASFDGTVRVWNGDGTGESGVLHEDTDGVYDVEWSPDGTRLVTATRGGNARVWEPDGKRAPLVIAHHAGEILTASWSPDGTRIVTASRDETARVWRAGGTGAPILLNDHEGPVATVAWSPDGTRIVTASWDGTARVWSASDGSTTVLDGKSGRVSLAEWSPDGQQIVTSSDDNGVRVWSADGEHHELVGHHERRIWTAAWSPDCHRLVTASNDGTARVWRADGAGAGITLEGHQGAVLLAAWSPDGRRLVTASADGTARVWQVEGTGEHIALERVLEGHQGVVRLAAWSPDGAHIATGSEDGTMRVWPANGSGEPLVHRHEGVVVSVAWSPDGTRLLTAARDKTARVWRADGLGDPVVLRGHKEWLVSAAWCPDGEHVVTTSEDDTARVWAADGTGEPVVLRGHEEAITSARWSPQGDRIATSSMDRTARVWLVTKPALQHALTAAATADCLSVEQRKDYLGEDEAEARTRYEACELERGRTPAPAVARVAPKREQ